MSSANHLYELLAPGEEVRGAGTAREVARARTSGDLSNGAWTFVVVTRSRLLWLPRLDFKRGESIPFESIVSYAHGYQYHRYVILLRHAAIIRKTWIPRHRFLWWSWGRMVATTPVARTLFVFSSDRTGAATALVQTLREHAIQKDPDLELDEVPREFRRGVQKVTLQRAPRRK